MSYSQELMVELDLAAGVPSLVELNSNVLDSKRRHQRRHLTWEVAWLMHL